MTQSKVVFILFFVLVVQALSQKPSIAVVQFDATNLDEEDVRILTDRLRTELIRIGSHNVVERSIMEEILEEQNFQQTGCISNECVAEVGKLVGVDQMVSGSIGKLGSIYTISAKRIDVESGLLLDQWSLDCACSIETVLTQIMRAIALRLSDKDPWTASELLTLAKSALDNENYSEAVWTCRLLTKEFPHSSGAAEAQYMLGDLFMAYAKDFEQALKEYRKVVDNHIESDFAPSAQFMIGYVYANFLQEYFWAEIEYKTLLKDFKGRISVELLESIHFELETLGKGLDEIPDLKKP